MIANLIGRVEKDVDSRKLHRRRLNFNLNLVIIIIGKILLLEEVV